MSDPFDQDELLLDDEWVELCDLEGRRASFRHLATIGLNEKVYMVLGTMREDADDEPGSLMLVREDETADGTQQYVVVNDKQEIEFVVKRFVMRLLTSQMDAELPEEDTHERDCGCRHRPWEFCFCDDPAFLQ